MIGLEVGLVFCVKFVAIEHPENITAWLAATAAEDFLNGASEGKILY